MRKDQEKEMELAVEGKRDRLGGEGEELSRVRQDVSGIQKKPGGSKRIQRFVPRHGKGTMGGRSGKRGI